MELIKNLGNEASIAMHLPDSGFAFSITAASGTRVIYSSEEISVTGDYQGDYGWQV
jgi:hypothetical protein